MTEDERPLLNVAPPVAPVGGGASARTGGVVVVGILLTVAWIGFSGRSATPPPPSAARLAVSTGVAPATPDAQPTPTSSPAEPGPVAYDPDDVFGAYAVLGDSQFITILTEPEPGHLTGRLRLPMPPPATEGTFVFQQFSAPSAPGRPVHIADWPMRVAGLVAASGREYVVVDAAVPARRSMIIAPRPILRGFRVTVRAQSGVASGELTIDIRLGPKQRLVVGEDGIFGRPMRVSSPEPGPPPFAEPRTRPRPRFSNESGRSPNLLVDRDGSLGKFEHDLAVLQAHRVERER